MINNKSILITGGTGSFGESFVKHIVKNFTPKKIVIFSRDELKQWKMEKFIKSSKKLPIRYFIGDVRDKERLVSAMQGIDIVVHAAALKQVLAAEYNPFEAIKTNVLGAQNIIYAALQNNVEKVIALSTDKAVAPINLYGATKLTADKLFIAANNFKGSNKIKFSVVRYGNVMGSRGSVMPLFIEKSKKKEVFTITHRDMTRFNITLNEGVIFVLNSITRMVGGEIFIPKLPSYNIMDLAEAINKNFRFKITGIKPGEKLHEEMISSNESSYTIEFDDYFVVCPNSQYISWKYKDYKDKISKKRGKKVKENFSYNSGNKNYFLTVAQLKKLIKQNL